MTLLKNDLKHTIRKTTLNKILVSAVVLLMLLLLSSTAAADTAEHPIHKISTADDLKKIGTDDFLLSDDYILTTDIQITDSVWNSIGNKTDPFTGIFDGHGHTITFVNDVTLQNTGNDLENGYGLFGNIENSIITGINIKINNTTAVGDNVGALVGFAVRTDLKNYLVKECHVEIPENAMLKGNSNVGGLVGNVNAGIISNCSANISGSLSGTQNLGGLIGNLNGTILYSHVASTGEMINANADNVGGLIGHASQSNGLFILGCTAEIETLILNGDNVGGLIGNLDSCFNMKKCSVLITGDIKGGNQVGGLIGNCGFIPIPSFIVNCSVGLSGDIEGTSKVGGFIGSVTNTSLTNSSIIGTGSGNISSTAGSVGGFIGYSNFGVTYDCFSDLSEYSVSGNADAGGFIGDVRMSWISDSFSVTDTVESKTENAGGFIGKAHENRGYSSYIARNSYSVTNKVTAQNVSGGFIGYASEIRISQCYSEGSADAANNAGGFIGFLTSPQTQCLIENCYSAADVEVTNDYSGGFIGAVANLRATSEINNCYSTGKVKNGSGSNFGGIVGSTDSDIFSNCFYDKETTNQSDTGNGEPKSTSEMKDITTFLTGNWLISNKPSPTSEWYIFNQNDYPKPMGTLLQDAIEIRTEADLAKIGSEKFENGKYWSLDADYVLANDIVITKDYTPIGTDSAPFTGTFSGKNGNNQYVISNLTVNLPNDDNIGLFGYATGASFSDVILKNVQLTGNESIGSLIGRIYESTIKNCSVDGGTVSARNNSSGGLIGLSYRSWIENSSSSADVYSKNRAGGLIGESYD